MNHSTGLIFDLDGTLIDSLDDITAALNRALVALNRPRVARESVRGWIGDGLPVLCDRAWPDAVEPARSRFIQAVAAAYRADCATLTRPYPNILKTLELLRDRNFPMAVLTNKPHDLTTQILDALDLTEFFRAIHGYVREDEKKPTPTVARRIADALGLAPTRMWMIGDSDVDVMTARNAGMRALAVTWGFRDRAELAALNPDAVVNEPLEIVEAVEKK